MTALVIDRSKGPILGSLMIGRQVELAGDLELLLHAAGDEEQTDQRGQRDEQDDPAAQSLAHARPHLAASAGLAIMRMTM